MDRLGGLKARHLIDRPDMCTGRDSVALLNQLETDGIMVAPEGRGGSVPGLIRRTEDGFEKQEVLPQSSYLL